MAKTILVSAPGGGPQGPQGPAGASGSGFDPTVEVFEDDFASGLSQNITSGSGTVLIDGYTLKADGGASANVVLNGGAGMTSPDFGLGHVKLAVADFTGTDVSTVRFGGSPFLRGHNTGQGNGTSLIARVGVGALPAPGHTAECYIGAIEHSLTTGALDAVFGLKITVNDTAATLQGVAYDGLTTSTTVASITLAVNTWFWVKVEVAAQLMRLYYSVNGSTWVQVGGTLSVATQTDWGSISVGAFSKKTLGDGNAIDVYLDYMKLSIPYPRTGAVPA